jgi:hypothetical protein
MDNKIIAFPITDRADRAPAPSPAAPARASRTRPSTSLALVLRSAPPELQPAQLAADMLATESNAAAAPLWATRKAAFRRLLSSRRLPVLDQHRLGEAWAQSVRTEGIQQKARKQAERIARVDAVVAMLERDDTPSRA